MGIKGKEVLIVKVKPLQSPAKALKFMEY